MLDIEVETDEHGVQSLDLLGGVQCPEPRSAQPDSRGVTLSPARLASPASPGASRSRSVIAAGSYRWL
jgi:hypothetical protein